MKFNPGIYRNLPFDEYGRIPAWSPSTVKQGVRSMKYLNWRRFNPKAPTKPMELGSAIHCSVLEPDEFMRRYVLWTGGRRAGSDYNDFCEANEGKAVLTTDEYDLCLSARDSARSHSIAGPLLDSAGPDDIEVSLVWVDYETGLPCKGRADMIATGDEGGILVDLKTTTASVADDRALTRTASQLGYHISLAAYQAGAVECGLGLLPVKIIFVEQQPPHDVRVMSVPMEIKGCDASKESVLARGFSEWQRLLILIAECEQTGIWPGCSDTETDLIVWHDDAEFVSVDFSGLGD